MRAPAIVLALLLGSVVQAAQSRPNVLFIAIDDLNDWVGCLGGHPRALTPHIDRLAQQGTLFENAHCQAPICVPSRTSMLTGTYPHNNGVYVIEQEFRRAPALEDAVTLPQYFKEQGYRTMGAGKIFHRNDDAAWSEWGVRYGWNSMAKLAGPDGVSGLPNPRIFDFGPLPADEKEMSDMRVTDWALSKLSQDYEEPFFLAVGLITPHLPWFTPTEYYESYPLAGLKLPATLPGDLDDLPPMGRKFTRYFDTTPMSHHNITRFGLWHKAVASYLACSTFTDRCVGLLLDALARGPHAGNTVIVLWSDHGMHLGEKMHWEKRSLWEESTRVPLIFVRPGEQHRNAVSTRPVGLIDVYPTLVELCGLPARDELDGHSLVPLLEDPGREWQYPALTTHHPGNHAVRTERWRYIRYANGDEELYDHRWDQHEFRNLAGDPEYDRVKGRLAGWIPDTSAPYAPRLPRGRFVQEFDWTKP
ncbi:MAG: sulfatase [bacterium]|nr:sulfatase [bacterium]